MRKTGCGNFFPHWLSFHRGCYTGYRTGGGRDCSTATLKEEKELSKINIKSRIVSGSFSQAFEYSGQKHFGGLSSPLPCQIGLNHCKISMHTGLAGKYIFSLLIH